MSEQIELQLFYLLDDQFFFKRDGKLYVKSSFPKNELEITEGEMCSIVCHNASERSYFSDEKVTFENMVKCNEYINRKRHQYYVDNNIHIPNQKEMNEWLLIMIPEMLTSVINKLEARKDTIQKDVLKNLLELALRNKFLHEDNALKERIQKFYEMIKNE